MIKDGFLYLAALIFAAAVLVNLPKIFKGKKAQVFFNFAPPIVLIYLGLMLLCTMKVWDLSATSAVYKSVKNPILYAMLFIMLLRCDLKKIIKLGPKMLIGFFAATLSIGLGFFVSYAIFHQLLGAGSWKALGALCGSWMGGGGNMLLTGDREYDEENDLLAAGVIPSCEVLKVGHHGRDDATSAALVAAVQPKVAVISTSSVILPESPAKRVLRVLSRAGAQIVQTQQAEIGVRVTLSGGNVTVEFLKN